LWLADSFLGFQIIEGFLATVAGKGSARLDQLIDQLVSAPLHVLKNQRAATILCHLHLATNVHDIFLELLDRIHEVGEVERDGDEVVGLLLEPVGPHHHLHSLPAMGHHCWGCPFNYWDKTREQQQI